jgi:predicted nucleic acid-binding Zn ribbon protein
MAEIRHCDQCGRAFEPRREHARFCSSDCRVAWNQEHRRDPAIELGALAWSVAALADLEPRLAELPAADHKRAAVAVSDAVWQVTIVDATLVRYHHEAYDAVLAGQSAADRRVTEGTMAGLRFVRNQLARSLGLEALIGLPPGGSAAATGAWTWQPAPQRAADALRSRGRAWQVSRYQAYQDFMAGRPVAETFGRAAGFVRLAAAHLPEVAHRSA